MQIKLYKAMAIHTRICTHGIEIWTITKIPEAKIKTTEIKFLRSVAVHTRKDQIINTKIRE
jgi:hypothetical protein